MTMSIKKLAKQKRTFTHTVAQYPGVVHEDEAGGYWVSCPILAGCYSQGETIDEALTNIRESIMLCRTEEPETAQEKIKNVSLHFVAI